MYPNMEYLEKIKNFSDFSVLNEDLLHGEQSVCNRAFVNSGTITFDYKDGTKKEVQPEEIIKAVNDAIMYMNSEYPRTFEFANQTLNIIYLAHSSRYQTMAVDKNMNLYLNAGFVYNVLKMDKILIAAVLMHEVFHALFNHIERGVNWLAAKGKAKNPQNWHDTNLAADVEVNQTLVRIGLIDEDRLKNEICGMYLDNKHFKGTNTAVLPMETVLNNEDFMNKLRSMCPPPPDPSQPPKNNQTIKTTKEWDEGYKDAWNKIAGLIKKYGYEKVWQKLQDAGLINAVGEIYKDKNIDDIKNLKFLQVKSYEDFINESLEIPQDDKYKTYDDGYISAFEKLVDKLSKAMYPQDGDGNGMGGDEGQNGPDIESGLKNDDLDQIDLPNQSKSKKKSEDQKKGVPENMKNNDDSDVPDKKDEKDKDKAKSAGQGGKGKDDEDLTDDDFDKLADDINKKTQGGSQKISTQQEISIGGTGSFEETGATDDDLKEAGYSDEDIAKINEVRKSNEKNNSTAKLEKIRDRVRRESTGIIKKYLDAIEIESNKYKNLWKDILESFMSQKTRRAGNDKSNGQNDWIRKKSIARGEYGIHHAKTAQDPQDINVYVDVSGSVDEKLLEIICKSLVIFAKEFKYSGINICPWATSSNGVFKVEEFSKMKESEITSKILKIVSAGISQCGGGTDVDAAIDAMIDVVDESLNNPEKKKKDDVHIIITDGWFDYRNVENTIRQRIKASTGRDDVAEKAPENTFWMIYDMDEESRKGWTNEIKKGTLIFINSEVVKNNG